MIRPQYDSEGVFLGFSALVHDAWIDSYVWTPPQSYKTLMRGLAEKDSEVLSHDRRQKVRPCDALDLSNDLVRSPAVSLGLADRRQLPMQRVREDFVQG